MAWWNSIARWLGSAFHKSSSELSDEARRTLGDTARIEALVAPISSPFGPVHVNYRVLDQGRTRLVLKVGDSPEELASEELLGRIGRIHSAVDGAEVVLLGSGMRRSTSLLPYLRPGRLARLELWTWMFERAQMDRPLVRAFERLEGRTIQPEAASVASAAAFIRDELGGNGPLVRGTRPAETVERELASELGLALLAEVGGKLDSTTLRWSGTQPEGNFHLDLGLWMKLWLERAGEGSIEDLPRELGRHLADPAYLLDPLTFVASQWEPPPTPVRIAGRMAEAMTAFVEMRAESALSQGAEASDSGDIVVECPGCHGLTSIVTAYTGTETPTLHALVLSLCGHLYDLEQSCSQCSAELSSRDMRACRIFRIFPELDADLAIQLVRAEDGRITTSVRVFAEGGQLLERAGLTEQAVHALTGRYISARSAWLELFERASKSGQLEWDRFDASSLAVVVPGGATEADERLAELKSAFESRGPMFSVSLNDLHRDDLPFLEGTYRQWAGRFARLLDDGRMSAVLMVDLGRTRRRFEEVLERGGGHVTFGAEGDAAVEMDSHRVDVPIQARLVEAVHTGRYPEERAVSLAAESSTRLRRADLFVRRIREICGPEREYIYDGQTGMLRVLDAEHGEGSTFNIPSLLMKFGGDEDQLERMIRAMSGAGDVSLERCKCGAPAYVSLKMKPPEWAASQTGTMEVVYERRNGVIFAYSVDCEEHSGYINRDSMDRLGLDVEELRRRFHRDLDQNDYQIGLLVLRDGPVEALGIVGTNAASLACHPALVRRALEIAGMELGERVRLHARSTDAIVVAPAGAGPEFLKSVADKLDHILSQSLGLSSISLRFDELVELPGGGRGRLREVFRVTRP